MMRMMFACRAVALLLLGMLPLPVFADACIGNVSRAPDGTAIVPATLRDGAVRITYVGHATFTIETPQGITAATDYNDYVRPAVPPAIATMNHAHSTHYTDRPDPAIRHVLRGWSMDGRPPRHEIQLGDMRVRNVPTNIRRGLGGDSTEYYGNSIFIFEAAGLCIAHLGHLHHSLQPEHIQAIGKVDVVLAAVDGSWTLDHAGIAEVIAQLQPKVVIPMHYFSERVLQRFLSVMAASHAIDYATGDSIIVSIDTLPARPTIRVLAGR